MKCSKLRNTNFIWKYLAGFLCLAAVAISFHKEVYRQTFSAGEECSWLPVGEYMLSVDYADAPEGSVFTLTAKSLVTPENEQGTDLVSEDLPAGGGSLQVMVSVPTEARKIYLSSEYVTGWSLQSVKLANYDNYFLAVLFLMLAAACLVYGTRYYRKEHRVILILIGIGVISSLPLFSRFFYRSLDITFHAARINGIYEGMRTGQFPVRINPTQLGGYGYITGGMYPQLFLYFPAILKFFHVSTLLGLQLLIFAANLATPLFTYKAIRNIFGNEKTALMAAAFYTLNPYRLINFYSRGALGEGLAMVFLPLVLWGTYEILWKRREKWWILALGMTGVLSCHVLSLELYAMLVLGEMAIWIFSRKKNHVLQRVLAMVKAAVYTVLLNLYFLGPFLVFCRLKPWCFLGTFQDDLYTLDMVRAFEPFAKWGYVYFPLGEKALMSVTLGSVVLAGICLFGAVLLKKENAGEEEAVQLGKRYLVLGSLFSFLALWAFPWEQVLQSKWLAQTLGAIQFPWRSFGVAALLFSAVTAVAVTIWEEQGKQVWQGVLWPVLLCVLLLESGSYFGDIAHSAETLGQTELDAANYTDNLYLCENFLPTYFYTPEYTHISCDIGEHISWINSPNTSPVEVCEEPETVRWTNYRKEGLHISADVSSKEDFYAAFPLCNYPGYHILVDGVETEGYTMYSLLSCDLPRGTHHIEIDWVTPLSFRICDIASLCVVAVSLVWCLRRKGSAKI